MSDIAQQEVPPALNAIIMTCLQKEPAQRFSSAKEMRLALESLNLPPWRDCYDWWELYESQECELERGAPGENTVLTVDWEHR